jgi:hypothetical protein
MLKATALLYLRKTLVEEYLQAKVTCLMGKSGENLLQCHYKELTMPVPLWTWMMEGYV